MERIIIAILGEMSLLRGIERSRSGLDVVFANDVKSEGRGNQASEYLYPLARSINGGVKIELERPNLPIMFVWPIQVEVSRTSSYIL